MNDFSCDLNNEGKQRNRNQEASLTAPPSVMDRVPLLQELLAQSSQWLALSGELAHWGEPACPGSHPLQECLMLKTKHKMSIKGQLPSQLQTRTTITITTTIASNFLEGSSEASAEVMTQPNFLCLFLFSSFEKKLTLIASLNKLSES